VLTRKDRRDLSVLGLVLLAWGLLVAPLLHSLTHAHGHAHSHAGLPTKAPHGTGSVEHLLALASPAPALPEVTRVQVLLALASEVEPVAPDVRCWHRVEQPQGP
jgi:hypothetical protein